MAYFYWTRAKRRDYASQISYISSPEFISQQRNIFNDYEICLYLQYENEPDGFFYTRSVIGNVGVTGSFSARSLGVKRALTNSAFFSDSSFRSLRKFILKSENVGFSDSEPRLYALKRKPFCVLLIDEIEKSSSNLYNIWLNMLEEGEITLSNGEKVSCRDCIIIFTGNVGTKSLELKSADIGFGSSTKEDKKKKDLATVMKEVKKEFRPEFLNRLNKIVVFNSLEKPELEKIFDLELAKLQERLPDYKIQVTKKLKSWITDKTEPKYGARSLQRLIIEYIEQELCKTLLETDVESKKKPIKAKFDLDKEEENVVVTI
jgi:hypothetical protein